MNVNLKKLDISELKRGSPFSASAARAATPSTT
jgi:hypothetical protein